MNYSDPKLSANASNGSPVGEPSAPSVTDTTPITKPLKSGVSSLTEELREKLTCKTLLYLTPSEQEWLNQVKKETGIPKNTLIRHGIYLVM